MENSIRKKNMCNGNSAVLTITPVDSGTNPISAHLTIIQIQ